MSYVVANPENRFSRGEAHFLSIHHVHPVGPNILSPGHPLGEMVFDA